MNIEEQRKAFEVVAEKLDYQLDKWSDGEYVNDSTKTALKLWLASANRQEYKLVLVEPTDVKLKEFQKIWLNSGCAHIMKKKTAFDLYKAMIGGVN